MSNLRSNESSDALGSSQLKGAMDYTTGRLLMVEADEALREQIASVL
jgi:hypothetical protein